MNKQNEGDTFAVRMLRAKSAECLTTAELARESGVSLGALRDYIDGRKHNPKMTTLVRLSKSLRVSVDYLCGLEDKSNG